MTDAQARWPRRDGASDSIVISRIATDVSYKEKAYLALKDAIINLDIYRSSEPIRLDERELSERLGVSRTPIREAVAMLEQEGFLKIVPRRGIMVVRKSKREIIEMIQASAALESMAVRLAAQNASDAEIAVLRELFRSFEGEHVPLAHLDEYSTANIVFHQTLIRLSGSKLLESMAENLFLHVRSIRHRTIYEQDRAQRSIKEHWRIIEAIEAREVECAEALARDHTLRLAEYVDKHVDLD